jgi:hypothetical protein
MNLKKLQKKALVLMQNGKKLVGNGVKMKIIILIMLFSSFVLSAKNIKDYFLMLPDINTRYGNLDKESKKKLLDNKNSEFRINTINIKNGFMSFSTTGDGEGANFEITYYNLKNKKKLVVINNTEWVMCCESSNYSFYHISGNNVESVSSKKILPDFNLKDFLKENKNNPKIDLLIKNKKLVDNYYVIKLPQKGKDITVSINWGSLIYPFEGTSDEKDKETLKFINSLEKDLKPLILKFKDGRFYK